MAIGEMLKKVLEGAAAGGLGLIQGVTGAGQAVTGPDTVLAQQPNIDPRGILGVIGALRQHGARGRIASDAMEEAARKQEREEETHTVDTAYKKAQTRLAESSIPKNEASAAYTRSRINSDKLNRELKDRLETERLRLQGVKNEADIQAANSRVQAEFTRAEAALMTAKAAAQNADTAFERMNNEQELKQRELDLRAARDAWEKEVADKRTTIYGEDVAKRGTTDTVTETVTDSDQVQIGEGPNALRVPVEKAPAYFTLFGKGGPGEQFGRQLGFKSGFLGFGEKTPPVTPVTEQHKKVVTKTPANKPKTGTVKVRIIKPGGKYPIGTVVDVDQATADKNVKAGNVALVK